MFFFSTNFVYKLFLKNGCNACDNVPRFKVKWYYTGESLEADGLGLGWYSSGLERNENEMNREFRKFVNLLLKHENVQNFWDKVIETRVNIPERSCDDSLFSNGFFKSSEVKDNFLSLVQRIENMNESDHSYQLASEIIKILEKEFKKNITEDTLNTAGEMFVYLNHCGDGGNSKWFTFYKDLFKTYGPDVILMTINRLTKLHSTQRVTSQKLLDYFEDNWHLKFRNITPNPNSVDKNQYKYANTLSKHPVHISDDEGKLSPSALIPFCEFEGNMSAMGIVISHFDVPVCNIFKAQMFNDHLCYEVDPNEFIDSLRSEKDSKKGLTLLLDYNEDRQVVFNNLNNFQEDTIYEQFIQSKNEEEVTLYLDTIEPLILYGEGQYNLNVVKEVKVTESYLGLDKSVKGCQSEEEVKKCQNSKECLPKCEGILVASYFKTENDVDADVVAPKLMEQYDKYKQFVKFPGELMDYQWKNKLRVVRIYFDTPIFDLITKDRAAKFVDMLSAIGGTMGLLTGFSIISGVEIIYFSVKIGLEFLWKKKSVKTK